MQMDGDPDEKKSSFPVAILMAEEELKLAMESVN